MNDTRLKDIGNYKRSALIALVLFVSYAYFYQAGGWNQNSRFDLVRAILDQHTLRIDSYHSNTEDKALFQGHYYSDKAPGVALLAIPVVAAVRPLLRWTGVDPLSPRGLVAESHIATILTIGLPAALSSACLFLLGLRLGSTTGGAAFAALSLGLATPVWAWATIFFAHALVGACLLFSFAAAVRVGQGTRPSKDLLWGLAVGLAAGWATVSEYPAAPASVMLAVLAMAQVWPRGWPSRWRAAVGVALGAGACLLVLMIYQYAAFGSPFQLGYTHYESGAFPWMRKGFLGLTFPRLDVMFKLLFGLRIGLFVLAPVTVAGVFGLRQLWKQESTRNPAATAAGIAVYYWLFNASFSGWHAGWTYGPRYMGAGIPLLCVGLGLVWARSSSRLRWLLGGLAIWGTALSLMAVATTAQPPQNLRVPIAQLIWPSFWSGKLAINQVSMLTAADESGGVAHGSFNLGQIIGLHGLASLLPLLALWCVAGFLWMRMSQSRQRQAHAALTTS
ncbi:MAG TPA: hypothetical protein VEV41_08645 [Terriglobales bacterium]|nr:hypothetical protein [Terriglobales bacterium]